MHSELDVGVRSAAGYTVEEAVADWLDEGLPGRTAKTVEADRDSLRPLLAVIGVIPLKDLTVQDVRAALKKMAGMPATRTLQKAHNCLTRCGSELAWQPDKREWQERDVTMAARLEFRLLGPLQVTRDGTAVRISAGHQQALLAALLLNSGRVLAADELVEVLWGQDPPPSARASLHNYVRRLRSALGDCGPDRILTRGPGYLIEAAADELDVCRFDALLNAALAAARARAWDQAAVHAAAALSIWRGEPLADTACTALAQREIPRLNERRLRALEVRVDAELNLGRHADLIPELRQLAGDHPLRERLHELLMLALYRSGRQAEALAAYRDVRRVLIDELGTEPGAALGELQQRILKADPALACPGAARDGRARAVPRTLPSAVRHFAGRETELAALTGLLDQADQAPGTVVISAIGGMAGVGKTALAVHWTQHVAGRFPDGQLYVNLRGYDPELPMTADHALVILLGTLGIPGGEIPAGAEARAARYRSLLAGRRMLVLLDNARSAEQVRPLLPGTAGCVALVTSRDSLAGLVARDGARRLDLDLLPMADAVALLRALIGTRVDDEPGAAAALAERCCRLPLALRVAAELSAARPAEPLASLAGELADQQRLLDLLEADGDQRAAVRAVFSWSYRNLDADTGRAFRLAGLHPGPAFDRYAVAALTDSTVAQADRVLERLGRAHLIQPARPGRYGMHDLLRVYASELAAAEDGEERARAALTRLFDHYLHAAAAAMDAVFPAERHRRPRIPAPATPVPPVTGSEAARAWLDCHRATLIAVAAYTAGHGWPGHTARLAGTLTRYLDAGSHYAESVIMHSHARDAARRSGDRAAEAAALCYLGLADLRQGRYEQAAREATHALALYREADDRTGQARALTNLGNINVRQGFYRQAARPFEQALALFRDIGDRTGQSHTLSNLGMMYERLGRYQQAADHLQQGLDLCRATGDKMGEAYTLASLGCLARRQRRYGDAADLLRQALSLCRQIDERTCEAHALAYLGLVDLRQGRHQQAADQLKQALALFLGSGDRSGQAWALNGLGEVVLDTGTPTEAVIRHTAALEVASQIGDHHQQARAHHGLGCAWHALGDCDQARRHWQQALTIYTDLGVPEADQVRARLAADRTGPAC